MLAQFRHIQKGLLIVVTILIVIAFAFLYSDFDFVQGSVGRQNCVVKVYDRCYRQKEVQQLSSHYDVAVQLGMYDFVSVLFGENRRDNDRTDFILSLIVLREEASRMGIEPTAEEIKEAIPRLPIFQQPFVNANFVENQILGPNGFTDGDLAQLVKDYLSFQQLRELIGSGIAAIPSETDLRYIKNNQRYTASLVTFEREDFVEKADVSEEDVKEYFEENQDDLKSDPKRRFDYVKFLPLEMAEEATNEEKANAVLSFNKAVNRAYADLADEEADFMEVAAQYEGRKADFTMKKGTFEPFAAVSPPEEIKGDASLVPTLFSESLMVGEVTVPVPGMEEGFYVFKLSEVIEPEPLTLEEATPAIREALTARESNRLVSEAANEARAKINEVLEGGKKFPAAAKAAKVSPALLPNFSEREPPADTPDASLIVGAVEGLSGGELSTVVERPGGTGYLLVFVDRIEIYEEENESSMKRSLTASAEAGLKRSLFSAWFNQRRLDSGAERPVFAGAIEG